MECVPPERSERRFLTHATVVFLLGLVLGTFVNPLFWIPDERFHADLVRVAAQTSRLLRDGWPLVGERNLGAAVTKASRYHTPKRKHTTSTARPRNQRVPFEEFARSGLTGPHNRMTQHPPLYYLMLATGEAVADVLDPGLFAHDVELWVMRLVNVLLLAPVPILAYATARRISNEQAIWWSAAILPLGVPGLMLRNGPILNNDNLITVLGAGVVYVLVRVVDDDLTLRTAVVGGVLSGLAMLTKGFGLILFGTLGLGYGWVLLRRLWDRESVRPVATAGLLSAGVAFLSGGWWYVRTMLQTGRFQQTGFPRPEVEGFVPDWGHWLGEVLSRSWESFWGGSYVLNDAYGSVLTVLLVLTAVGVAAAFLGAPSPRRRRLIVAAVLPALVLAVAVYARQSQNYLTRGRIGGVQGRYLYGGLTGVTTAMVVGMGRLLGRRRSWLPVVTTVGAGLLYSLGVFVVLMREWGAESSSLFSRALAVLTWSGPPPWLVIVVFVGFALAGLRLAWIVRPSRP